jgi:hypothetical protein
MDATVVCQCYINTLSISLISLQTHRRRKAQSQKPDAVLLRDFRQLWVDFTTSMSVINNIFNYLVSSTSVSALLTLPSRTRIAHG